MNDDGHSATERRNTWVGFFTLFAILAAHVLTETARDALFLERASAADLPYVYIGVAMATLVIAMFVMRAGPRVLTLTLWVSAGINSGFWLLMDGSGDWAVFALYIWTSIFGGLAITQFWLVLARLFTIGDAKRLYAFIGAGSVAGALAGAAVATGISTLTEPRHILLASALVLVAAGFGPAMLKMGEAGAVSDGNSRSTLADCIHTIQSHPYIKRLGIFILLGAVVFTLADYVFKSEVQRQVPPEKLGAFFAVLNTVLNAAALAAQLLLTRWLLRRLGVLRSLWIMPALMLAGGVLLIGGGGLLAALVLKGTDGSLKHSLNRTITEVLYLPIPERLRRHSKAFIDMVGQRGAQALASVVILAIVALVDPATATIVIASLLAACCLGWMWVAGGIREHYLDLFRDALREGSIDTRGGIPELDLASLEALIRTLNSDDDMEVTAAMQLLADNGKAGLIPALILYHPSEELVLEALSIFEESGRDDFLKLADRLARGSQPRVAAAALRARSAVSMDRALLDSMVGHEAPEVAATALVVLAANGETSPLAFHDALHTLEARHGDAARLAACKAIRLQPHAAFSSTLERYLRLDSDEVLSVAAQAAETNAATNTIDQLIGLLDRRAVRLSVRSALVSFGEPALKALATALSEPSTPVRVRLHVPRTISLFDPARASRILLGRYPDESRTNIQLKILRGLGRLRANNPSLRLEPSVLDRLLTRVIDNMLELATARDGLINGDEADATSMGHALLVSFVSDKAAHLGEHVFRLLGLRYPMEDFESIYRAAISGDRAARANAFELLGYSVDEHLTERLENVVAVVVDRKPTGVAMSYKEALGAALGDGSEGLRAVAAYRIAELGLTEFEQALRETATVQQGPGSTIIERALALFDGLRPAVAEGGT